ESGDRGRVRVTRPTSPTFSEQHHRQLKALDQLEQPVLLTVVHLTLCASEDHVVVGEHSAAGVSVVKEFAIDSADTSDQSIRRRSLNEVLGVSSSPLGCDDQRTVLNEAV